MRIALGSDSDSDHLILIGRGRGGGEGGGTRRFFERKKSRTQFSRKNIQDRENSTICFVLII